MAEETDRYASPNALATWIHDQMRTAKSATAGWRANMEEDFAFYAGDQWSQEDAAKLEEQGRPSVAFNRFARTINAVCGLEVQNRQEVRYLPRESTDNRLADYYSACVKWVRDECDAEDEDSEAFQDASICGMGWTQTRPDYDRDPDGTIDVSRFDPGEAFWDPGARKRNLVDRHWCARVKRYQSREALKAAFPQYRDTVENSGNGAPQYVEDKPRVEGSTPDNYDAKPENNSGGKQLEVVCFNWYDSEPFVRVADPATNQMVEFTPERFEAIREKLDAAGVKYVKQRKRVYYHAYVCGNQVLLSGESEAFDKKELLAPTQKGFVFNCITGLRNRNDNTWFGLGRLMIDPQRWANKWLSQTMHIMNANSKGGLLAEKDAFENPRKAEESWADPEAITWLKSGALAQGKVKEKNFVQLPAGFHQLMAYAVESINETPGINTELMGIAERDQPAVLEETRKRAGVTMLGILFAALRLYRKEQGRVLADMVSQYLSDGRKIRIIGQEGRPEVVAMMKEAMNFTYDIAISDSPNSPSMKDKNFAVMRELLPVLATSGVPIIPELLDHMPLPADLVEKWKAQLPKAGDPKPPPPEVMKAQAELKMKQEAAVMDQQNKAADRQADLMFQQEQARLEREKAIADAQLKRELAAQEAQLKREQAEADVAIEKFKAEQKAALDIWIAQQKAAVSAQEQANNTAIAENSKAGVELSKGISEAFGEFRKSFDEYRASNDERMGRLETRRVRRVLKTDPATGTRYSDEIILPAEQAMVH